LFKVKHAHLNTEFWYSRKKRKTERKWRYTYTDSQKNTTRQL